MSSTAAKVVYFCPWRSVGRWLLLGLVVTASACRGEPARDGAAPTPGATVLVGAFRGPYTTLGMCGNCETQDRFLVETTGQEVNVLFPRPVPGQEWVQTQKRCRAVGRFVDHQGSCGEGQCRSFVVEAVQAP